MDDLIRDYGLWAVLVVTFFEGETIVILAGVAVAAGQLQAPGVIGAALVGSVTGDQLWYYLGRRFGRRLLARKAWWLRHADRVLDHMQRHERWLILTFRFYYGLRAVTPFVIGAGRTAPLRFLGLNLVGAVVWAISFTVAGYLLGDAFAAISSRWGVIGSVGAVVLTMAVVAILVMAVRRRHADVETGQSKVEGIGAGTQTGVFLASATTTAEERR